MKRLWMAYLTVAGALAFGGCAEMSAPVLVHDTVRVPLRFQVARGGVGDISDHERYLAAYEDSWWRCLANYLEDIEYHPTETEKAGNGWPSEWEGGADGFNDAERQVESLIRRFGKAKTREALKKMLCGI